MVRRTSRTPLRSDERGMALALALLGIIVIGALVAGTFTAGRLEMTAGRNVVYSAQAAEAAEAGLHDAFINWNANWNGYDELESSIAYTDAPPSGTGVQFTQIVTKLSPSLFLVQSTGVRLGPGGQILASRTLGQLARITPPDIDIQAAVTANAEVRVGGSAQVDGIDDVPAGWAGQCPAASGGVFGIRTSDEIVTSGNAYSIDGTPEDSVVNDTTVTAATFTEPYNALSALANITFGGGGTVNKNPQPTTTGTPARCDKTNLLNWGEPYRDPPVGSAINECINYFPVIHYTGAGALRLSNGRAQGIILSAADINIAGNFEFNGIMIAMGSMNITGTGNKVSGAILTGNADIADDLITGNPVIQFSSCAITTVLTSASQGVPLADRNWVQRWQ